MQIFVGNSPFATTEDELRQRFAPDGNVQYVRIVPDRETGRPQGFAFVEMPEATEAQAAMTGLQGATLGGRILRVDVAHPRGHRRPRRDDPRGPRW